MAQAHRLLTQQGIVRWLEDELAKGGEKVVAATWGIRTWNAMHTPVKCILRMMPRGSEVVVGYGGSIELAHSARTARPYSHIQFRYTQHSHAKYLLVQQGKVWTGFIGSSNLSDSMQYNLNVTLTKELAARLSTEHRVLWQQCVSFEMATARYRELGSIISARVLEPNDTQEVIRG